MRAAIYTRISLDLTGKAAGVKRQETDCRTLVENEGWDLVGVWTDNDRSATDRKKPREAFQDMLTRIHAGDVDAIVVWHVDRLYRQPRELEDLIDFVEQGQLSGGIHTVTAGDLDLSTASGRLVAGLLVQVSKHEVDRTRERLSAMNRHAATAGKRVGGRRAFGYETDGYTIRESEAKVWREMADRVIDGATMYGLVVELNERGVKTAGGSTFTPTRLRETLKNPRYAALRTYKGDIVADADWPPLIARARWERLMKVLDDPARRTSPGPTPKHLLSGFMYCGKCGAKMSARRQRGATAYGCKAKSAGGCGGVVINAEPVEKQVTEWIFESLALSSLDEAVAEEESPVDDESAGSEIADLESRLDDLAQAFAAGEITIRQLTTASDGLRGRLDALRAKLVPRRMPLTVSGYDTATGFWSEASLAERRELVTYAVEKIVVNPARTPGWNFHDPERVEIRLRVSEPSD